MKLSELIDIVNKRSNKTVNQAMISRALGVTTQSVNNRLRNDSEVTITKKKKVLVDVKSLYRMDELKASGMRFWRL